MKNSKKIIISAGVFVASMANMNAANLATAQSLGNTASLQAALLDVDVQKMTKVQFREWCCGYGSMRLTDEELEELFAAKEKIKAGAKDKAIAKIQQETFFLNDEVVKDTKIEAKKEIMADREAKIKAEKEEVMAAKKR